MIVESLGLAAIEVDFSAQMVVDKITALEAPHLGY